MYKKSCLGRQVKKFYSPTIEYVTVYKKSCVRNRCTKSKIFKVKNISCQHTMLQKIRFFKWFFLMLLNWTGINILHNWHFFVTSVKKKMFKSRKNNTWFGLLRASSSFLFLLFAFNWFLSAFYAQIRTKF